MGARVPDVRRPGDWSATWGLALEVILEGPGLARPPMWLLELLSLGKGVDDGTV